MSKENLIQDMLDKKAEKNNVIDLNAYGCGLADMYDKMQAYVDEYKESLIDEYERRLKTVMVMIRSIIKKDDSNTDYVRLRTKAACYRSFIAELKRKP